MLSAGPFWLLALVVWFSAAFDLLVTSDFRVWRIVCGAMANDPKQKARADVRHAQSKVAGAQSGLDQARAARRESFERARKVGLSLAEIAKAADLHRSRVDQILRGE
jgi:hypothetical protein